MSKAAETKQVKQEVKMYTETSSHKESSLWLEPVWPDWAIYWTLGNFLKPLATINLPKSPTFLGNFCKFVKKIHFAREIIFGQLL